MVWLVRWVTLAGIHVAAVNCCSGPLASVFSAGGGRIAKGYSLTGSGIEDTAVVDAAFPRDEAAFTVLVERHRRELRVHCYRMLGSFQDAEDLVQETFLRAWRGRAGFQGRSTVRAWLYRIATNACLDFLDRHPATRTARDRQPAEIGWLQPFRDQLLEPVTPSEAGPDAMTVAQETIELAFLVATQHLPARQRAVLAGRARLVRGGDRHHAGPERRRGEERAATL